MAVINRNSLVLNNVSVVRDAVTGTMDNGLNSARVQLPASPSILRRTSHCYPQTAHEPGMRHDHADIFGVDDAARRAGRSGGSFASRSQWLRASRNFLTGCSTVSAALRERQSWPLATEAKKQTSAKQAWFKPAWGMPLASIRRG
jgi:hypothetical protein